MIFKSINKLNSLIALIILAIGFWLLSSGMFKQITMYALFVAGIISVFVLKIDFKDLFKPITKQDIKTIILGVIVSLVLAISSALLLKHFNVPTATNPIHKDFQGGLMPLVIRLLKTIPQLLGEELLTLLPFLMIVKFFSFKGLSVKKAGFIALTITSIIFGLLHLKTYNWNVVQCLLVISLARIPFTLSFMKSKNIVVPWTIHVLYDWFTFIVGAGAILC